MQAGTRLPVAEHWTDAERTDLLALAELHKDADGFPMFSKMNAAVRAAGPTGPFARFLGTRLYPTFRHISHDKAFRKQWQKMGYAARPAGRVGRGSAKTKKLLASEALTTRASAKAVELLASEVLATLGRPAQ